MKIADFNLEKTLHFDLDSGRITLGDDRMLIMRQESFAVLRKLLTEQVGGQLTMAVLSQFGYRCGEGDHESLTRRYQWDTEMDEFSAGPVMHTHEGIVHVEPTMVDMDRKGGHFHMTGIWRNSYEAENYLKLYGPSKEPVCHSLAGYASGWCSAFMGKSCVAIETKCAGRGDERCEFEIKLVENWGPEAELWIKALGSTDVSLSRELEDKLALIEEQRATIAQMSSPIMQIWEGVLCLPVVGLLDTARSAEMTDQLLNRVVDARARCVLVDVTGIDVMDTKTADHFIKMAKAVRLLGAEPILTGISPAIAQTMAHLGVDLENVTTLRTLQDGLEAYLSGQIVSLRRSVDRSDSVAD